MSRDCVIGLQWGDEGKGTIVDVLSSSYDIVARYGGGCNAGHTVTIGNKKYKLNLVPSGIFQSTAVIGSNVVIHPSSLVKEITQLRNDGINIDLYIDYDCPVTALYHVKRDEHDEKNAGRIGTTCRGVGPTYENLRKGFTLKQLVDGTYMEIAEENLKTRFNDLNISFDAVVKELDPTIEIIEPFLANTKRIVRSYENVLFEGAQGYNIGIYTGDRPFVTCSDPNVTGIADSFGFLEIKKRIGVFKAYSTRVGDGPFPTELNNDIGDWIRKKGNEYGTTTGRPRRCGWLDCQLLREAVEYNAITDLAITHIDTLSDISELYIHTVNGQLKAMKTWSSLLPFMNSKDALPANAQSYLEEIESQLTVPITIISTGPERNEKIPVR